MTTRLTIGPRNGEFGKSWTRSITPRVFYYFELRTSPAGRRLMVMRCYRTGGGLNREIVHWLYDCDPAEYEAYTTGWSPR